MIPGLAGIGGLGSSGAAYAEIGNLGLTSTTGTGSNIGANLKMTSPTVVVPSGGVWVKRFYIRVRTAPLGGKLRPILYSGTGNAADPLTIAGQEHVYGAAFTNTSTEIGPINWNADGSAVFLAEGTYLIGAMVDSSQQFENADNTANNLKRASDTYSDGAAATYGTITQFSASLRAWMPYSLNGP